MIILGIETSCDETAAAILEQQDDRVQILSNIIGTSAQLQEKYGGIIPEQAAREQLKSIIPVIEEALRLASFAQGKPFSIKDIDVIAVTYGPGLIGSLLVGVETAKVLSTVWQKPLIPVNHLIGHFYANWIDSGHPSTKLREYSLSEPKVNRSATTPPVFPCIGLLVSGGHTDLVLFKDHGKYQYLGGTRDDAAGECFDKCARLIGYPYPGGPKISKIAEKGDPNSFQLPRPMLDSKNFSSKGRPAFGWDFSFSGLKTAFATLVNQNFKVSGISSDEAAIYWKHIVLENDPIEEEKKLANLCASLQQAIIDTLVKKTIAAIKKYGVEQLIVAGGVAANQKLTQTLKMETAKLGVKLNIPPAQLCTDNAAMIAAAAFFLPTDRQVQQKTIEPTKLDANPNLALNNT